MRAPLVMFASLAALAACTEAHSKERVWVEKTITAVHAGGALPMQGSQIPSDPVLAKELAIAHIAINESTAIAMEYAVTTAGTLACAAGKLVGAKNSPVLSVEFDRARVPWKIVHASTERRCRCDATGCAFR